MFAAMVSVTSDFQALTGYMVAVPQSDNQFLFPFVIDGQHRFAAFHELAQDAWKYVVTTVRDFAASSIDLRPVGPVWKPYRYTRADSKPRLSPFANRLLPLRI